MFDLKFINRLLVGVAVRFQTLFDIGMVIVPPPSLKRDTSRVRSEGGHRESDILVRNGVQEVFAGWDTPTINQSYKDARVTD